MRAALGLALAASLLVGCPKSGANKAAERDLSQFECNDRQVGYMVAGGFAAEEAGVTVKCPDQDPQLVKWRLEDGERKERKFPLSAEQFDSLWEKVDSTGWRHLDETCKNPKAEANDPVYLIDVSDYSMSVTLNCDGKILPFPYDRIVNELDLRAAGFGDQETAR